MPVIDHRTAPEIPWRPEYRVWRLAGQELGFSLTFDYHVVEPGAGAPPHYHKTDELLVVLEGTVEAWMGGEVQQVGKDHTIAVPVGVHHSFTSVGPGPAMILVFFPVPDAFSKQVTIYLDS